MNFGNINNNFMPFEDLYYNLRTFNRKYSTLLIGIDGCGGSGKSTFARELEVTGSDISTIHMDDFYLPSAQRIEGDPFTRPVGSDFDWQRVRSQVIEPVITGEEIKYQRYDWNTDSLSDWKKIKTGGIVIIEGVYSTRDELTDYYDFRIWVDCPRDIRLKRGIARDGEAAREIWENKWMVEEDRYIEEHKPHRRADLYVDGVKYNRHYKLAR